MFSMAYGVDSCRYDRAARAHEVKNKAAEIDALTGE
jgi:hypothetical protein